MSLHTPTSTLPSFNKLLLHPNPFNQPLLIPAFIIYLLFTPTFIITPFLFPLIIINHMSPRFFLHPTLPSVSILTP
jgi:hypothetical protein